MRIRAGLAVLMVAGLASLTAPVAAAAEVKPEGRETSARGQQAPGPLAFGLLRNGATGRCLEERPDRTVVTGANPCNGTSAQKWQWQSSSFGPVLVNERSRLCLTGTRLIVYTSTCDKPGSQSFVHQASRQLTLPAIPNYALDSNANGDVYLHESNSGNYQKWSWG